MKIFFRLSYFKIFFIAFLVVLAMLLLTTIRLGRFESTVWNIIFWPFAYIQLFLPHYQIGDSTQMVWYELAAGLISNLIYFYFLSGILEVLYYKFKKIPN